MDTTTDPAAQPRQVLLGAEPAPKRARATHQQLDELQEQYAQLQEQYAQLQGKYDTVRRAPADPGAGLPDELKQKYAEVLHKIRDETCTRCRGTGHEPPRPVQPEWLPLLQRAYAAGLARETHNDARNTRGREKLLAAYDEIKQVLTESVDLVIPIPQTKIAQAVGVSRAQLHNIQSGKAGEHATELRQTVQRTPRRRAAKKPASPTVSRGGLGVPAATFDDGHTTQESRAGALAG